MVSLTSMSLRYIGKRLSVPVRKADLELFTLNSRCSFPLARKRIGVEILRRPELAVAAGLIGLSPVTTTRDVRSGDKIDDRDEIIAMRSESSPRISLLDVLRSAKGIELLDDLRNSKLYNTPVHGEELRSLYSLMDMQMKKRFWLCFDQLSDMEAAHAELTDNDLIEAFGLLPPLDFKADFWISLKHQSVKNSLLAKMDPTARAELLNEILFFVWLENINARIERTDFFTSYFNGDEQALAIFNRAGLLDYVDIRKFVRGLESDVLGSYLRSMDPEIWQTTLISLMLQKYIRSKKIIS